jgi:hypothetical protein
VEIIADYFKPKTCTDDEFANAIGLANASFYVNAGYTESDLELRIIQGKPLRYWVNLLQERVKKHEQ